MFHFKRPPAEAAARREAAAAAGAKGRSVAPMSIDLRTRHYRSERGGAATLTPAQRRRVVKKMYHAAHARSGNGGAR